MAYTLLFNLLCKKADDVYGGMSLHSDRGSQFTSAAFRKTLARYMMLSRA